MTHGSLFTGIGGIDLGLERAGFETIWQVERDEYARRVLEKHWPGVRRWNDIASFPPDDSWRCPDLISGGFPCQDLSCAGKRAGLHAGRSGLWWEMLRVIRHFRPRLVLVENVPALLSGGGGAWASAFFGSLAESGYDCEWDCIPAAAVGAPHLRYRVFVVAYTTDSRSERRLKLTGSGKAARHVADAAGLLEGRAYEPRRQAEGRAAAGGGGEDVADDPLDGRRPGRAGRPHSGGQGQPAQALCNAERLRCDRHDRQSSEPEEEGRLCQPQGSDWWAVEPEVGRVAHGVPDRVDRLRCLGNAVVPQVAEWIGRRIMESAR